MLTTSKHYIIILLASSEGRSSSRYLDNGVWLSLARAPGLGPGGRRFESCHPDQYLSVFWTQHDMQVWFNGRTSAFQAEYVGSIPITCFKNEYFIYYARVAQLVEHDLAKVGVAGSSPVSRSSYIQKVS